jgi:hypothetical protein
VTPLPATWRQWGKGEGVLVWVVAFVGFPEGYAKAIIATTQNTLLNVDLHELELRPDWLFASARLRSS